MSDAAVAKAACAYRLLGRHYSFELRASPDGLQVRALGRTTVKHLHARMNRVGTIDAGAPVVVGDGQYLVVSHYPWRYRAVVPDLRRVSPLGAA